jgi:hypothetical protein
MIKLNKVNEFSYWVSLNVTLLLLTFGKNLRFSSILGEDKNRFEKIMFHYENKIMIRIKNVPIWLPKNKERIS